MRKPVPSELGGDRITGEQQKSQSYPLPRQNVPSGALRRARIYAICSSSKNASYTAFVLCALWHRRLSSDPSVKNT